MSHGLFIEKVKLEPIAHKYFDAAGNEYMSVSKFSKKWSQQFEEKFAYRNATPEKRGEWEENRTKKAGKGTHIHDILEYYEKHKKIKDGTHLLEDDVKNVLSFYSGYNKLYQEVCLYDDEYMIAGTTDKICAIGRKSDGLVDIADYKTDSAKPGGIVYESEYNDFFYPPIDHLQVCNHTTYTLKMSVYAFFFERITGRRVRKMYIHHINPDNILDHKIIPVMYMKNDIKALLDKYAGNNQHLPKIEQEEELTF